MAELLTKDGILQSDISNGYINQWQFKVSTQEWKYVWTFPIAFTTITYIVNVTHFDRDWNTDSYVKTTYSSYTECWIGGSTKSGLEIVATAVGY